MERRKAFPSHMWHSRAPSVKIVGAKFRSPISGVSLVQRAQTQTTPTRPTAPEPSASQ
jgi:hypothetical protein